MTFYRIGGLSELVRGYKGIPEPVGNGECYRGGSRRREDIAADAGCGI